jgi:predicted NBD/HSP70 family sugar kinase
VRPSGLVVGVDLGHSHLRVVTADLAGNVLGERVAELDIDRNADAALDASAMFITELLAETGAPRAAIAAVVLGLPGPLRHEVVGSSSILPGWTSLEPAPALARRIGLRVRVDNDANLGALGETTFGAARGIEDVIYVKVSTGIGAGLVLGGRLYRGATGGAGELGHVRVNEQGVVCRCGSRGCLETLVSAPAIIATLQPAHTAPLSTELIVALAREGDPGTRRVLGDAGRQIGRAVADLCIALDPAAIVVGGELARASDVLLDGIRQSIDNYAQPGARQDVRVLPGGLGDRAEALGAVALAIETATGSAAVGAGSV